MAEFKLGRIRFVWKNAWTSSTVYYRDDVITYGGKTYICVIGHTSDSANFFNDFDITPPKWNLVADGQSWKGDWQPATTYLVDDIVKYGATLYIANEAHTSASDSASGLEADQSKWTTFADGLDWRGDWSVETKYYINDLVKYGGKTYVANQQHTSAEDLADGLEADQSKWDEFNEGLDYKGDWAETTRYKLNDVVKYGASLWIATTYHTATGSFTNDESNWTQFVRGFQFENDWSYEGIYQPGDVVRYGGYNYVSKTNNENQNPVTQTDDWDLFSQGIKFQGEWGDDSSQQDYYVGNVVRHGGYQYLCIADHQNQEPPNATYWTLLNTGLRWRNDWTDDAQYLLGDIVKYGDNAYICVQGHISEGDDYSSLSSGAEDSRPDLDTSGTYWNIFVVGNETSVLTTKGDLVYYDAGGPTRLPIGIEGQVLKVSNDKIPEWAFLGQSDDVYYVAEHGVDGTWPTYGSTIDKPFRGIRYACEQIEKGVKKANARKLLENNRIFIQREVTAWTEYQVANAIDPFAADFEFDTLKCERDIGFIVDAVVWDITHGGNVKSREAALKYVNEPGGLYINEQEDQTIASINYMLEVVSDVLTQTDPDTNYQTENGDNSTAVVTQYKNSTIAAETGTYTEISGLVEIITDAIEAEDDANIPARLIRNSLVRVSTGKYYETLPVRVPAETCVIGDELRSTQVFPKKASNSTLTPRRDVPFSYAALERLEPVMGDIVRGVAVTPTTGNDETQSQEWPFAEADQEKAVEQHVRGIRRKIDSNIGDKLEANYPVPDNIGSGYKDFRELILLNKEFIKAEIIAYIADQYSTVKYSKTKCKQDTGFILDALAYDLTYGGDWQSQLAGKAYYDGNSGNLQIASSEKTATLAAYGYLKTLVQTVGRNITVSPTYQDVTTQIGGTGGSTAASTSAGTLVDTIIDIIDNGVDSAPDVTYPDISDAAGVTSGARAASELIISNLPTITEQTIDFITNNFGTYKYNAAVCRRDLTNILTDIVYDIAFNTNYNQVYSGIAYTRPTNAYLQNAQKTETIGALKYAKGLVGATLVDDGSSAGGSSTMKTRSDAAFDEIIDILQNGTVGAADPGDGVVAALSLPDPASVVQNRKDAKDNLVANRQFIASDVVAYVNNNAPPAGYDQAKCERDVKYIVDALSYDILYQGTQAITRVVESYFGYFGSIYPEGQVTETVAAYNHLSSIVQTIVQENTVTAQSGNIETQIKPGTPASATEATELGNKMTILTDALTAGNTDSVPAAVFPTITNQTADEQDAVSNVNSDRKDIVTSTIQYISDTYTGFKFNHAKCTRDLEQIARAARFDFMLGSNFASIVAAYSYLRAPSKKVLGDQKAATLAANEFAKIKLKDAISGNTVAENGIDDTWQWVEDVVLFGSREGSVDQEAQRNNYFAIKQLRDNREFIVEEAHAHVTEYFKDTVTLADETNNRLTISDTSWLRPSLYIEFEAPDDSTAAVTDAGLAEDTVYYVRDIISSTEFTIAASIGGAEVTLTRNEGGQFTVKASYDYSKATCTRDVNAYIDAIIYDLQWSQEFKRTYRDSSDPTDIVDMSITIPGIYETHYAARFYANAVLGSQEEDFYYLRNGTGLRLQTMDGLAGDLGPENAFGTSRPTAGAYASLDPGWGPKDKRVWITARSPYVQNVTTFGYAAIGQKIDGKLHDGGNDSIVSNDFTQVISDGIGAWITNNGRAELVSVFSYYAHIGYLAENGGRIRGTNGNNSYGDFGSVAEGVDEEETAITAIVDNKFQYNATISNVETDTDSILNFEFSHAGNDYTRAEADVFGAGDNEEVIMDEFRDQAVFQCRINELNDSSGKAGGKGYLVVSNTAQAGSSNSVTLSATDGRSSTAYIGMKVLITGGAGVGQFGIVDTYNAGTKIATVTKESDGTAGWDHLVPGTTITNPNSSSTYQIEPAVSFSAPTNSSTVENTAATRTFNEVAYVETSKQYLGSASTTEGDGQGATFDVSRVGTKYTVTLDEGGTGYKRLDTLTISGANLDGTATTHDITITATTVNSVTGAIIAFDTTGVGSGGQFVALTTDTGGSFERSVDGENWVTDSIGSSGSGQWNRISSGQMFDGSSAFSASKIVAVTKGSTIIATSEDANTWTTASMPAGITVTSGTGIVDVAFGTVYDNGVERFIIISDADRDVLYSDDGVNFTRSVNALPATGYDLLTHGQGRWVAIASGSTNAVWSDDGLVWNSVTLPASETWEAVAYGNGRFIAIASTNSYSAISLDGKTWIAGGTLPTGTHNKIAYGQGRFVVTNTDQADQVGYTDYGLAWDTYTPASVTGNGHNGIAFGAPQRVPYFIAAGTGATDEVNRIKIPVKPRGRVGVASERIFEIRLLEPGSGITSAPTMTVTDPNNTEDVDVTVRLGDGALSTPSFRNRGSGYQTASAEINATASNGNADFLQTGSFIAVRQLTKRPVSGSNVEFDSLPGQYFKLVNVVTFLGSDEGSFTCFLQISPDMENEDSPVDGDGVTMRIRYSQVRLTGHDFLDIGTGNFTETNYPGVPTQNPNQANETKDANGGRVFYTSTDQDGNFRVGDLFTIEQSTGVATLNAEAFNIAGLQELTLGEVTLGGNSAAVSEFSTDPFFTANSDSVVPTQRAVKAYIESQIGGGGASLNVNSVTAGDIFISTNEITTLEAETINIKANVNFSGTVLGYPLAIQYLLRG